ncbi:MAG: hypothetical protein HC896_01025 [Bacteroidales bacterium]|nr:hypothetical protein [Bacteroidales bacterium]
MPGATRYIQVSLAAAQKTLYSGQARVYSNEGRTYTVNLSAEGIEMPLPVSNMLPADGAVDIQKPVQFSWAPALNAKSYSIVISDIDSTQEFRIDNITNISYSYHANNLNYGETYTWKVISHSYGYSVDGPTQQFTIRELPDLIVPNMVIPQIAFSGRSSEVEWTVRNVGIDKTIGNWYDYAYLSLDTVLQAQFDIFLGGTPNISYLEVNESYNRVKGFTLPNGVSGNYHLIVKTNATNSIPEISTANNTSVSDTSMFVDLTPPPDLRVFSTNVPALVFSGQPTTVQWTVKNYGTGPTAEHIWYDHIYLSDTTAWGQGYWRSLGEVQHTGVLEKTAPTLSSGILHCPKAFQGLTICMYPPIRARMCMNMPLSKTIPLLAIPYR